MRRARALFFLAFGGPCFSCAIISAEDYVGPPLSDEAGAASDGTSAQESATDARSDAAAPTFLITRNAVANATGRAQQSHLFYSSSASKWVFFTFDAANPKSLATRVSTDFATWTDGAPLTLPQAHTGDGRDFAAASVPGSPGAFHLALSLADAPPARGHYHARAVLGTDVAFGDVAMLGTTVDNQPGADPDGPAVVANSAGTIFDLSGWDTPPDGGIGSSNVIEWVSTANDNGGSWAPDFAGRLQLETVDFACNARTLVGTSQGALALWESGDVEPLPHGLHYSNYTGTKWSSFADVGFESASLDVNDWSAVALGSDIHVVRRADHYAHRIFRNGSFLPGLTMPDGAHATGAGVLLLAENGILNAYTFDPDGALLTSSLGKAWSTWTEVLAKGSVPRTGLTGVTGTAGTAFAWMEQLPEGDLGVMGFAKP